MWYNFTVCTFNDLFSTACKGFIHNSTAHMNAMHVYVDSFSMIFFYHRTSFCSIRSLFYVDFRQKGVLK